MSTQKSTENADGGESSPRDHTALDAAVRLESFLRTCLGPDGQYKMFTTDDGYVVTDDIHRVFDGIEIPDPIGRFVAQHAVAQKEDVGDGSLTTLVLAGALAREANSLLDEGYRSATVERGYEQARTEALKELEHHQRAVDEADRDEPLRAVARTSLNSARSELVDIVVKTARQIAAERQAWNPRLDLSDVLFRVSNRENGPPVELVRGVVLERDVVHNGMATQLDAPRIAVLGGGKKAGSGIEERSLFRSGGTQGEGRTEVSFTATSAEDVESFRDAEVAQVREQVARLEDADIDAVFCTMGISDVGKSLLRDADITAFRALTETKASILARATGGTVVMDISDMTDEAVGTAGEITVDETPKETTVTVSGCPPGTVATLIVAGALGEHREERERDLRAAITTVLDVMSGEPIVPGGGGTEVRLAAAVRKRARSVGDRTAMVMEAYADALEAIPRTLATNGGVDQLDTVTDLRRREGSAFETRSGEVCSAFPSGPLTSARVARTAIDSATHVATRLLRIDDVLEGGADDDWISADEIDPTPVPERDFDY